MEKHFTSLIDQCFHFMFQTKDEVPHQTKKIIVFITIFIVALIAFYFTI
jgi:hypothetical protein